MRCIDRLKSLLIPFPHSVEVEHDIRYTRVAERPSQTTRYREVETASLARLRVDTDPLRELFELVDALKYVAQLVVGYERVVTRYVQSGTPMLVLFVHIDVFEEEWYRTWYLRPATAILQL